MADILIAPGSTIPAAPTGQVTLFLDTENNNILSYVNEVGDVFIYNYNETPSDLEKCCSCEIAKKWTDAVTCALKNGDITATEFGTITLQGLKVTSTENINPTTGEKICTVEIGQNTPAPVVIIPAPVSSQIFGGNNGVNIDASTETPPIQLISNVLPLGSNQAGTWTITSGIATVSANGLVTMVSAGTATITFIPTANPAAFSQIQIVIV